MTIRILLADHQGVVRKELGKFGLSVSSCSVLSSMTETVMPVLTSTHMRGDTF